MDNREPAQIAGISRWSIPLGVTTTAVVAAAQFKEAEAQIPDHPLALWTTGPAKEAFLRFVRASTDPSKDFVAAENRIATFDQNGTL